MSTTHKQNPASVLPSTVSVKKELGVSSFGGKAPNIAPSFLDEEILVGTKSTHRNLGESGKS